ncbi:MAG: PAS domain-containing protein [Candidatus Zixiibacteriota bacterium]
MNLDEILKKHNIGKEAGNEIKKAFRDIQKENDIYHSLINSSKGLIYVKDKELRFLFVNDAVCRFLNLERKDIIGKKAIDLSDLQFANMVEEIDRKALNEGIVDVIEEVQFPGKEKLWFHNIRLPINDKDDNILGIGSIVRNVSSLKNAEKELAHKKRLLRQILDNIPAMIFYKDLDEKYAIVNMAYADFVDMKIDAIEGSHVSDVIKEKSRLERYKQEDRKVLSQKQAIEVIEPYFKDRLRWFQTKKLPIFDNQGDIIGILGFASDITNRKKAEEKLRLQSTLLDSINESVMAMDLTGHIIFWNKGAERLYGYESHEVLGKVFTFIFDPDYLDEEIKRFEATKAKGVHHEEYRQYTKNGESFYSDKTISVITDASGYSVGFMSIDRDVSDKVNYRQKLKESQIRYRQFFDQSFDGILMVDENCIITQWNKALEKITGIESENAIGQYVWDIQFSMMPENRKSIESYNRIIKATKLFAKEGKGSFVNKYLNYEIQKPDGEERLIQLLHFPIKTDKGYKAGSIVRDMTENRKTELALIKSEEHYRNMFNNTGIANFVYNDEGRILQCNQAFADLTGYSVDEIQMRMNWRDMADPERLQYFEKISRDRILGKGMPPVLDFSMITKSGEQKQIIVRTSDIPHSENRIASFLDISDSIELKSKLELFVSRINHASEATNDVYWDMDIEKGEMVYVSPNWLETLGYEKHEFPHTFQTLVELTHPEDMKVMFERFNTVLEEDAPIIQHKYRMRDKSGKYRWFLTRGKVKSKTKDNKAKRVIGTQIEITGQMFIEEKFNIISSVLKKVGFMIITDSDLYIQEIIGENTDRFINYTTGISLEKYLKKPAIGPDIIAELKTSRSIEFTDITLINHLLDSKIRKITISLFSEDLGKIAFVFILK